MQRVIVVGAGVVGLSCAVRLLEAGHRVDVVARDLPLETTSAVAAALWYPYRALPQDRVTAWSATSYDAFGALAGDDETGVRMLPGTEVLHEPRADPWWVGAVPALERTRVDGYADGWTFTAPVVEMPVYLRWLAARVDALGGTITRANLSRLPDRSRLVVNCAGIGSRLLAQDLTVTPVRGQVVLVAQTGLERWWLDESGPTYVVPRSRDIVVGGTDDEGDWSRTPDPETADRILARAVALVPELAGRERAAAPRGAAPGAAVGARGTGRGRRPLLRPGWCWSHALLGLRRRGGPARGGVRSGVGCRCGPRSPDLLLDEGQLGPPTEGDQHGEHAARPSMNQIRPSHLAWSWALRSTVGERSRTRSRARRDAATSPGLPPTHDEVQTTETCSARKRGERAEVHQRARQRMPSSRVLK